MPVLLHEQCVLKRAASMSSVDDVEEIQEWIPVSYITLAVAYDGHFDSTRCEKEAL